MDSRHPAPCCRPNSEMARLPVRTSLVSTEQPVRLTIEGRAAVGDQEVTHEAVPADDRMQAFLWRHLVPAADLMALVFDPPSNLRPRAFRRR